MLKSTIKIGISALLVASLSQTVYGENARSSKASWYSQESCRKEGTSGTYTANGERFYDNGLTCAIRSRNWGRMYRVTNSANGKTVIVRHNDFGPGKKATARGVVIDLSPAAFSMIADKDLGIITVTVEVME